MEISPQLVCGYDHRQCKLLHKNVTPFCREEHLTRMVYGALHSCNVASERRTESLFCLPPDISKLSLLPAGWRDGANLANTPLT